MPKSQCELFNEGQIFYLENTSVLNNVNKWLQDQRNVISNIGPDQENTLLKHIREGSFEFQNLFYSDIASLIPEGTLLFAGEGVYKHSTYDLFLKNKDLIGFNFSNQTPISTSLYPDAAAHFISSSIVLDSDVPELHYFEKTVFESAREIRERMARDQGKFQNKGCLVVYKIVKPVKAISLQSLNNNESCQEAEVVLEPNCSLQITNVWERHMLAHYPKHNNFSKSTSTYKLVPVIFVDVLPKDRN